MSELNPITHEEQQLAAILEGKEPLKPILHEDLFYAALAKGEVPTAKPITRKEMFLKAIAEKGLGGGGGGSLPSAKWNDVTFIDYDGKVLYSYSVEEAQALSELPPLPEHSGLICQGWNYDLETIKSYNRPVTVGAMYITDDGKTRIYITLTEGRTSPMLGVGVNGTVTVDWGDGTDPDVLTGTNEKSVKWTPTHEYAVPGDYAITLSVDGTIDFLGSSSSNQYSYILRYSSGADSRNEAYHSSVKKIEIGENIPRIGGNAFRDCKSLKAITIPKNVLSIGNYALRACESLSTLIIPNRVSSIDANAFENCYSLLNVSIPSSVTTVSNYTFGSCYTLSHIELPDSLTRCSYNMFYACHCLTGVISIPASVTEINQGSFANCRTMTGVVFLGNVTNIASSAFETCCGIGFYDFTNSTIVPTLAGTSVFSSISADCKILVPATLYDEWIAATNWSTYASQIVAV